MTANTGCGYTLVFATGMTRRALDRDVRTVQLKSGFLVVIKADVGPLYRVVTRFTLWPETALVYVVLLVAGYALPRCFAILAIGNMAALAFGKLVCAIKPEFGRRIMFE